ncbi:MAG: ribosome small subunit-dependent GTPase A [Sediminicola sp.]
MLGTVYKSTGSWYTVKTDDGDFYECKIKGKFRMKGIKSTNPIAVGDRVTFQVEHIGDETLGIIEAIKERKNYIVRKSVNLSKQTHIIAANLDQVFLMVTLNNPPTSTSFIDRFLVTSEAYQIPAALLFNKVDSYSVEELDEIKYLAALYRKVGYTCLGISAVTGKNVEEVKEMMKGKTSMFSGHSGVGKSTLVNTIDNALHLKTAIISEQHSQGQHTTTFAEMYDMDFGARIIDTPGIKGFGIVDMEKEEIGNYFPEFFKLKNECKFNNCLHMEEPKCAVKDALEKDQVSWSRYRSYVQMVTGEDEQYRMDIHGKNR